MATVVLNTSAIVDWPSFHDQSVLAFGFPEFYGRNMNAWIDCLTYLTDADGMSRFVLAERETLIIQLPDFKTFSTRVPEICLALLQAIAFVNLRSIQADSIPRLVLELM